MDLRVENVAFGYPGGFNLEGINLDITSGSFLGLIGPNGSGKSTLLRLMSGALTPKEGKVLLANRLVQSFAPQERAREIAVIFAEQQFEFPFRVRDVVAMGRFPHSGRTGAARERDDRIVDEALELTETRELQGRSISQLSTGERQRVLIARAMAQEPSIMLLDEPDAHLDLHHQLNVFRLLERLNCERSISIVAVLHDLTAAASFCRRLALLDNGRLLRQGSPVDVVTTETIRQVYGADILVCRNPLTQKPMVAIAGSQGI